MSESYPADADLLALIEDGRTGVPFIQTGQAPYYLQFRQMLYRLLANLAPLGLRVYKTGSLTVQVKPGVCPFSTGVVNFAGTSADITLTNNATNYLYLQTNGTVGLSITGWPVGLEHVKLATVVTAAGTFDFANITDFRGAAMLSSDIGAGHASRTVITGTTNGQSPTQELATPARFKLADNTTYALTITFIARKAADRGKTGVMAFAGTASRVSGQITFGSDCLPLIYQMDALGGSGDANWGAAFSAGDTTNDPSALIFTAVSNPGELVYWTVVIDAIVMG